MRFRSPQLIVALLALLVVGSACSTSDADADGTPAADDGSVGVQELAPEFSVPTADGGTFSLAEHLSNDGRPVFLNLWASWCFPCREEMPDINEASLRHSDIAFVGVDVQDSRGEAEKFLSELGIHYTIGFDDDGTVDATYAPVGLPASYIISADGVILERIYGRLTDQVIDEKLAAHFG